jgi:uncharacterized protein with PIN domain
MFVDASAIVAMMTDENDAKKLAARLEVSKARLTSAIAVFEATAGVARVLALPVAQAPRRGRARPWCRSCGRRNSRSRSWNA